MSALEDIRAGRAVSGDCAPVAFSPHSVQRFAERLRAGVPLDEVRRQLSHMRAGARIVRECPEWVLTQEEGSVGFLLLGTDVCMPLRENAKGELVACTALTSYDLPPTYRSAKNKGNASRRAGKRTAVMVQKRRGGRRQAEPDASQWGA